MSGYTLAAIEFTERETEYLELIAEEPDEMDLHNDLDLVVGMLRSIAAQLDAAE